MRVSKRGIAIMIASVLLCVSMCTHAEAFFNKKLKGQVATLEEQLKTQEQTSQAKILDLSKQLESATNKISAVNKQVDDYKNKLDSAQKKIASYTKQLEGALKQVADYDALKEKYENTVAKLADVPSVAAIPQVDDAMAATGEQPAE